MPQLGGDYNTVLRSVFGPQGINPTGLAARLRYLQSCEDALETLFTAAAVVKRRGILNLMVPLDSDIAGMLERLGSEIDDLEPDQDREEDDPAEESGDTESEWERIGGGQGL